MRGGIRRRGAFAAALVLLAAASTGVRADVLCEGRASQSLLGHVEQRFREHTAVDRRCTEAWVTGTGLDGRPLGGIDSTRTIVRLDLGLVWEVRDRDSTYTQESFALSREVAARLGLTPTPPPRVLSATRTGRRERVAGRDAERVDVVTAIDPPATWGGPPPTGVPEDSVRDETWIAADFTECALLRAFESRYADSLRGADGPAHAGLRAGYTERVLAGSGLAGGCVLRCDTRIASAERARREMPAPAGADSALSALAADFGRSHFEMTAVRTVAVAPSVYEVPRGYRRQPSTAESIVEELRAQPADAEPAPATPR